MADPVLELDAEPLLGLGTSPYVIQAYRIHLAAATRYVLPAGSVTLIANEIIFDDGVVIDVSGSNGQPEGKANPGAQPGDNGSPGNCAMSSTLPRCTPPAGRYAPLGYESPL